jgi:hypothetical protein
MSNAIKELGPEAGVLLELCGIDPGVRPEDVSVKDWCLLANVCYEFNLFE